MMALLRRVADPATPRARTGPRMRIHMMPATTCMVELGASSKLNAEWAFLEPCCATRAARAAEAFLDERTAAISASARRSTSTACSRASEPWACSASCSASPLLVWLAFRGWTCCCSRRWRRWSPPPSPASRCWRTGPRPSWAARRSFLAQFFPLFLLGALFGKLMEDSGSVTRHRRNG